MSDHQKIERYIINSTPFGELQDVLKNLGKLSSIDLHSSSLNSMIQQYNQDHLAIASGPHGSVVVMRKNKVGDNQYVDQKNQKLYTLDHINLKLTNVSDFTLQLMPEVKELVKSLSNEAQAYVNKYFRTPNGSQVFAEINEEGLTVHLGLTSKNISIEKFYTGEWISKWQITKDWIIGQVNIKAHFWEGGNVQFNQKKEFKEAFEFSVDMMQSAKKIMKTIQKIESGIQQELNGMYEDMSVKFFKKLRKLAPYSKTRMSWNINQVKMKKNLIDVSKHH